MLRTILLTVASLYLITVGLWPAAAAPVSLAFAGLAVLIGLVPTYVWALAAGAVWLKHRWTAVIQTTTA